MDRADAVEWQDRLAAAADAVIAFECEAYGRHDGGDHEIFVGRVVELHENQAERGHTLASSAASTGA